MSTGDRFVSIQPKRIMGFLDFRDRMLDYFKAQLTKMVEVAYGDDGTAGTTITMSEFGVGADRFQLDNDAIGSDGQGHFTNTAINGVPSTELSGRDVGIAFENAAATPYRVALHFAERPRGIQINPRTGFPEFLEFEETVGNRDEPDLVTDNGSTITFRINSVARLFGADAALDQSGRRCLVWKKTPGKAAITEGQTVELLDVVLTATNNEVTSTGLFGQSTGNVSENESDYFVLLLGPSVSLESLAAQTGYHFIGTVNGQGTGVSPTFDLTGQNNIGPLISDINVISELHHGNRKLRTIADNSDVDETQLEIRGRPDAGSLLMFSVDEDGDIVQILSPAAANQFSRSGFGGAADGTAQLKVYGTDESLLQGGVNLGSELIAGGAGVSDILPRVQLGTMPTGGLQDYNLITAWAIPGGQEVRIYARSGDCEFAISTNANFNGTTGLWAKDVGANPAGLFLFQRDGLLMRHRLAGTAGTWADSAWEREHDFDFVGGATSLGQTSLFGTLELAPELAGSAAAADALVARMVANPTDLVAAQFSLLYEQDEGTAAVTPLGNLRIYMKLDGSLVLTGNARWDNTNWNKDDNAQPATKFTISSNGAVFESKEHDNDTPWIDTSWDLNNLSMKMGPGDPAPRLDVAGDVRSARMQLQEGSWFDMVNGSTFEIQNGVLKAFESQLRVENEHAVFDRDLDLGAAWLAATQRDLPRLTYRTSDASGSNNPTGLWATLHDTGSPAEFRMYRGNVTGDTTKVRQLSLTYNAKVDNTDGASWLRDDPLFASAMLRLEGGAQDRTKLVFYTHGRGDANDWNDAAWQAHFEWDMSDDGDLADTAFEMHDSTIKFTDRSTNSLPGKLDDKGYANLNALNIPQAWARIRVPVAAGTTRTLVEGYNIKALTAAGLNTDVEFNITFNSSDSYMCIITHYEGFTADSVTYEMVSSTANSLVISCIVDSAVVDQSNLAQQIDFNVLVFGRLT